MGRSNHFTMTLMLALVCGLSVVMAQSGTSPAGNAESKSAVKRIVGEVTGIDAPAGRITLKDLNGQKVDVAGDARTTYQRVPLGETTLTRATTITLQDVGTGDRARVMLLSDTPPLMARSVLVISKSELTAKEERDRAEWSSRGIGGRVTAINAETKEISLLWRGPDKDIPVVVAGHGNVLFRRYSPDSIRFSDAQPSSFSEIKVGDHLRAKGEKSADGSRFQPEEIVFGAFRILAGTITAVNAETGELKINDLQKKPLTIVVTNESMVRRLTPNLVQQLEEVAKPSAAKSAGGDLLQEIRKLPQLSVKDLGPGHAVLVSSTQGSTPSRVTGIVIVTGVETFVKKREQQPRELNLDLGGGIP